jgi:hypothetical protein
VVDVVNWVAEHSPRHQTEKDLHNIGLTLQAFHDTNECFPTAIRAGTRGWRAISWREALDGYLV